MKVINAPENYLELPVIERSRYSLKALTDLPTRRENGEKLVYEAELLAAGLQVEPFWQDPNSLEGDRYHDYIQANPNFNMAVRQSVFDRLLEAAEKLPDNWQIVIKAGLRPFAVQKQVLEAFLQDVKKSHPNLSADEQLNYARQFVADPEVVCPPHTTGGAVDMIIRDKSTGQEIDMGGVVNELSERSYLYYAGLSSEQFQNRQTLLRAMLAAGFAPNAFEWWHYQYGEAYWAVFYGHDTTLYDVLI